MGIQSNFEKLYNKVWIMASISLIFLLIVGTSCSIHARFVKKVLPNQFEIELEERGTRFTQKVRFDEGGNLRITEVPNHNDINGATLIFDKSTGLQLDVVNATRSCFLHQPFFTLSNKYEESILDAASYDEDVEAEFLKVEPEKSMTLELITVEGPELDRADVPSKMAKYCTEGFQFFAVKQIPVNPYNVHKNGENGILIEDPRLQKDMKYGDPVDFSDLFQILPMTSTNRRSSRVKRECRIPNSSDVIPDCHWIDDMITCQSGCDALDIRSICRRNSQSMRSSETILLCLPLP